jgi:hypothetical protein
VDHFLNSPEPPFGKRISTIFTHHVGLSNDNILGQSIYRINSQKKSLLLCCPRRCLDSFIKLAYNELPLLLFAKVELDVKAA